MWRQVLKFFELEPNENSEKRTHRRLGVALVLAGISIVVPGFRDAVLSYINRRFQLHLDLEAPIAIGILLIALGLITYFVGELIANKKNSPAGTFVAVRHQSFLPLSSQLTQEMLPLRYRRNEIHRLECDQSQLLTGGVFDLAGAVRLQSRLALEIAAVTRTYPEASIGYYGIVHIPFQFLAGCEVSTWPQVVLFEHQRDTGKWRELSSDEDSVLKIRVDETPKPTHPSAVVVRIAVSYNVPRSEVAKVVPGPYEDICISIAHPSIDSITSYEDITLFCRAFRKVLDDVHSRVEKTVPVNVFYAGPVSLGFSLGRQISKTIHHRVTVFNYTANSDPAYAWGLVVNSSSTPETMLILPAV